MLNNDTESTTTTHSLTHSLTAALDQLRVVASSTSNDRGPRSRQRQLIQAAPTELFEHSYNWHRACQTTLLLHDSLSLSRSFLLWLQPWSLSTIILLWHSFLIIIIIIIIIGQCLLPLAAANFSVDDPAGASSQQQEECWCGLPLTVAVALLLLKS